MGFWGNIGEKAHDLNQIDDNRTQSEKDFSTSLNQAKSEQRKARMASAESKFQNMNQVGGAAGGALGKSTAQALNIGRRQPVTFSREQEQLQEMFGQGDKIWGTNNQPVQINNDLNPSRSDPFDETGSMFGFGGQSERSGLF